MSRIGVFVCHCGTNIAATVDVEAVAEAARVMPNVAFATTNKYTCSDPGQQAIVDAIKEHNLDRLVIASCSPRMHEQTFRKMLAEKTDINPYMLEIANIREQCSWVHKSKEESTPKAIDLVAMAVAKVDTDKNLYTQTIPVNRKVLVVGAGIAGIQAALDVADAGFPVTLVERNPSIGGKMVKLDKTFPTMLASARPRCLKQETTPTSLSKRFLRLKRLRAILAISKPPSVKGPSISTTTYALAAAPVKPNAPAKQRTNSTRVSLYVKPFASHLPKLFLASRPSTPTPAGN